MILEDSDQHDDAGVDPVEHLDGLQKPTSRDRDGVEVDAVQYHGDADEVCAEEETLVWVVQTADQPSASAAEAVCDEAGEEDEEDYVENGQCPSYSLEADEVVWLLPDQRGQGSGRHVDLEP